MRLPGPIGEPRRARRIPPLAISIAAVLVIGGGTVWALERSADESAPTSVPPPSGSGPPTSTPVQTPGSQAASSTTGVDTVDDEPLLTSARLLDTRAGRTTVDGELAGAGPLTPGRSLEVAVTGRVDGAAETGLASLTVTATATDAGAELVVESCGSTSPDAVSLIVGSHSTASANLVVPLSADGLICVTTTAPVEVVIDLDAFLDQGSVRPFPAPVRIVDSTPTGETADGRFEMIGVRPERSTLRIPVSSRYSGLADVGALMVSVSIVGPLSDGTASVFAAESPPPAGPLITYVAGEASRSTAIVPIGTSGDLCVSTTGSTDLVVELLALVPASASPVLDSPGAGGCPGQTMFPDRRLVALYGTQRSDRLGALGEQDPEASAARLAEVAEPWRAGDRPVQPAFELIATLATGTPEQRGDYNIRAEPAFVQEYLDVARRHGYYLILDLQPGQSDFLTEAKYYEAFLRQPDVGLALDPEWRTEAPALPRGGDIGEVDASEVNAVIDYLAQLVADNDLPEKLLVVHQFHDRMITNRDQLRAQPGVAVTIHMDGFGDRRDKLLSYDMVRAAPPFHMGLKLFYDEDIDLFGATEVLGGLFDPVPDMVTYQ